MTSMTFAERALELFQRRLPPVERLDWLANQLLALAAECGSLSLRILPSFRGEDPTFECSDSDHALTSKDRGPLRVFRTLLARLAKMAEEENGADFEPYGGRLHFDRPGPGGPVRLDVEFKNTTVAQSVTLTKAAPPRVSVPAG